MRRTTMEVVLPMLANEMSYIEYVFFKALAAFNSSGKIFIQISVNFPGICNVSARCTTALKAQVEEILVSLNQHYDSLGYDQETMAQRAGNLVLLLSSVYVSRLFIPKSKLRFFKIWFFAFYYVKKIFRQSEWNAWKTIKRFCFLIYGNWIRCC